MLTQNKPDFSLFGGTTPTYLWVANKPLRLDGAQEKLEIEEFERRFAIKYSESIWIPNKLSSIKFKDSDNSEGAWRDTWEDIRHSLKEPIHDKLSICYINDQVGYGVFARDAIEAGTIVAIYAGKMHEKDPTISLFSRNYAMIIEETSCFVDAAEVGGIARFFQHMPYSSEHVEKLIKSAFSSNNLPLVKKLVTANGLALPSDFEMEDFSENLDSILEKLKEINAKSSYEMERLQSLTNSDNVLAYANLKQYVHVHQNIPIIYFQACFDISSGDQLGVSYGLERYWMPRKIQPKYFDINGKIIQDTHKEIKTLTKTVETDRDFLPGFNKGFLKRSKKSLETLEKEYGLKATSQNPGELEKGLRMAALNNKLEDLDIFIDNKVNINAKNASAGDTALHIAARKGNLEFVHKLLEHGADLSEENKAGETPIKCTSDPKILELLKQKNKVTV